MWTTQDGAPCTGAVVRFDSLDRETTEIGIVVAANGVATDFWGDGVVGVPQYLRMIAEEVGEGECLDTGEAVHLSGAALAANESNGGIMSDIALAKDYIGTIGGSLVDLNDLIDQIKEGGIQAKDLVNALKVRASLKAIGTSMRGISTIINEINQRGMNLVETLKNAKTAGTPQMASEYSGHSNDAELMTEFVGMGLANQEQLPAYRDIMSELIERGLMVIDDEGAHTTAAGGDLFNDALNHLMRASRAAKKQGRRAAEYSASARRQIVTWMRNNIADHVDEFGEADPTGLAEAAAYELNLFDGNDIPGEVFDLAAEVAFAYDREASSAEPRFSEDVAGQGFSLVGPTADELVAALVSGVDAPYVGAHKSNLGGPHRVAVLVTVSADPRDDWTNNILENSRYAKLDIRTDGTIEHISANGPRFRKTRAKSVDDAVAKINKYVATLAAQGKRY